MPQNENVQEQEWVLFRKRQILRLPLNLTPLL